MFARIPRNNANLTQFFGESLLNPNTNLGGDPPPHGEGMRAKFQDTWTWALI